MRAILSLAILAVAIPGSAAAGFFTGNQTHDFCTKYPALISGYVAGYLEKQAKDTDGAKQATSSQNVENPDLLPFSIKILPEYISADICVPNGVTLEQLRDVYCKYLDFHPEKRHLQDMELLEASLSEVFPCPKK